MNLDRFLDDSDLRTVFGVPRDRGKVMLAQLEREGFPQPDPIIGKWWGPAVKAFLDRRAGLVSASEAPQIVRPDGEEKWP